MNHLLAVVLMLAAAPNPKPMTAAPPAQGTPLTPADIVARCRRAYDSLQSYACQTSTTETGSPWTVRTSAEIEFARPARIRADVSTQSSGIFSYVSDGRAAYERFGGAWKRDRGIQDAIAGATGIGQNAATTIPALLLHTDWGYPFAPRAIYDPVVAAQTVNGHSCYRIRTTGGFPATYWVNKQTFLIEAVATDLSMGTMHLHNMQVIHSSRINPRIPAATFAAPETGR